MVEVITGVWENASRLLNTYTRSKRVFRIIGLRFSIGINIYRMQDKFKY